MEEIAENKKPKQQHRTIIMHIYKFQYEFEVEKRARIYVKMEWPGSLMGLWTFQSDTFVTLIL